jgi:hypothetical protein
MFKQHAHTNHTGLLLIALLGLLFFMECRGQDLQKKAAVQDSNTPSSVSAILKKETPDTTGRIEKVPPEKDPGIVKKVIGGYDVVNPVTKRVIKTLRDETLHEFNPWWNLPYPVIKEDNGKCFDLRKLPQSKRRMMAKAVTQGFYGRTDEPEVNFIYTGKGGLYPIKRGLILMNVLTYAQHENDVAPMGYQSIFTLFDSVGRVQSTFVDTFAYAGFDKTSDGRFLLTKPYYIDDESEMFGDWTIIDLQNKKKLSIPYILKSVSNYEESRVIDRGKYFLMVLYIPEKSVAWVIVDPYNVKYYARFFEVHTEEEEYYYRNTAFDEVFFKGVNQYRINFSGFSELPK